MQACTEDKFLEVLPMVAQLIQPLQLLCSLLQVSSTVRRTLQQTRGGCRVQAHVLLSTPLRFSSFCSWLPQHSGLISSVCVWPALDTTAQDRQLVAHMLQTALQASTAARVPGEAAPPPLQLQRFASDGIPVTPVLLSAVARTQPQQLSVQLHLEELTAAACAALGTLQSVRALSFYWTGLPQADAQTSRRFQDLSAGIGQLTKLTKLDLHAVQLVGLQLLPASLQELSLRAKAAAGAQLDLTHLTALTALSIGLVGAEEAVTAVQLPAGVASLYFEGSVRLTGPHMPTHVKTSSWYPASELLILQDLRSQQQPWSMELCMCDFSGGSAPEAGAALSACTSLTALVLPDDVPDCLPWSRHVAALTGLRRLDLHTCESEEQDLLQLTALTALTHLALSCETSDAVAVALASKLTSLCHLVLDSEHLQTADLLPAAAKLSGLRHLDLTSQRAEYGICTEFSKALTPAALGQLLPLTQLSYLDLPLGAACPSKARRQFLRCMPALSCIRTAPRRC